MDESPRRERLKFDKFSSGAIDGHRPSKVSGCQAANSSSFPRELSMAIVHRKSPRREKGFASELSTTIVHRKSMKFGVHVGVYVGQILSMFAVIRTRGLDLVFERCVNILLILTVFCEKDRSFLKRKRIFDGEGSGTAL